MFRIKAGQTWKNRTTGEAVTVISSQGGVVTVQSAEYGTRTWFPGCFKSMHVRG